MKAYVLIASLLAVFLAPLQAEYNRLGVPDSTEIRKSIKDSWLTADLNQVRHNRSQVRFNPAGQKFQVRLEETENTFAVIVCPEVMMDVDMFTEEGIQRQVMAQYLADASGSWILVRDTFTGKPVQIRVYFTNNSDVYAQFSPERNITVADFVIGGCFAARSVPIGIPFEKMYTASFADLLKWTEKTLPWNYAKIMPGQYHDTLQMIGVIRKNLSRITYADDAAYDEDRKPVRISDGKTREVDEAETAAGKLSLSDAGFVKWVIDGIVEPQTGSGCYLKPLVQQTVEYDPLSFAGHQNEYEAISFTLDWVRNLSAARLSAQTKKNYSWESAGVDVKVEPFSAELTDKGIAQTSGYIPNSGYQMAKLRPVLYTLSVTEPTYFYLAAIRRRYVDPQGKNPELYKFDRTAVLFPYFDSNGRFTCVVFENGTEISLSNFVAKYKSSFVHMTRVLASREFYPQ